MLLIAKVILREELIPVSKLNMPFASLLNGRFCHGGQIHHDRMVISPETGLIVPRLARASSAASPLI